MNAVSVIKESFKDIKKIARTHFTLAMLGAFFISIIAVVRLPLYPKLLSASDWFLIFLPPLISLFFFYAAEEKPIRSVFWFTRLIYLIFSPFIVIAVGDIIFGDDKTGVYSEHPLTRFLPIWFILWISGCIILKLLAYALRHASQKALKNDNPVMKAIRDFTVMYTPQKVIDKEKNKKSSRWVWIILCLLLIALAVFLLTVTLFLHNVYSNMEFEAILFTITFAAGGLALEDLIAGFLLVAFFCIVLGYLGYHLLKCFNNDKLTVTDTGRDGKYTLKLDRKKRAVHIVLSLVLFLTCTFLFSSQTNFAHYIKVKSDTSGIYEKYYVEPTENVVSFPGKKRNLIYIFLESMENTYASRESGGSQEKDYISGLSKLICEKDSVNFSNTDRLGGASVFVPAISHTMGSTVAQTTGITTDTKIFPLWGKAGFPPVKKLEDILHDNGYNQVYIEGSKGAFSMYDTYVGRYDDSLVYDRENLAKLGYSDESADYIWKWGIEDRKLIDITKELITEVSKKDKPFFVTMYTMDTHTFECGHRCQDCDEGIYNDYLAAVDCSSNAVAELVEWIKQQPFYADTTIILVGDHLGNQKTSKVDIDEDYIRTTYNCFINPAKTPVNTKNRIFSSLDMFPTTLSAIGADIEGDRLGLGTDLFSSTPTLCEELGDDLYKEELEKSSGN